MRNLVAVAAFIASFAVVSQSAGARGVQAPADIKGENAFASLGPQPSIHIPNGLESLIDISHAAVLAEIESIGPVRLEEQYPSASNARRQPSVAGFATYRVFVRDVLFNKLRSNARPITSGMNLELDARVGRKEAEDFVSGKTRVVRKDVCLLYLYYKPASGRWALQPWMMQFRQTKNEEREAESVVPGGEERLLASSFALARRGDSTVVVDWNSLVEQTRAIALRKQVKQPDRPR